MVGVGEGDEDVEMEVEVAEVSESDEVTEMGSVDLELAVVAGVVVED